MASHFLGAAKHITLLEADAEIVGLYKKQKKMLQVNTSNNIDNTDGNAANDEQKNQFV